MHIRKLQLLTHDPDSLKPFYLDTLGLTLIEESPDSITFKAGATQLQFVHGGHEERYHFAFNIPENQFDEAKTWLETRVPLIKDGAGNNTFPFPNWNAHAMYFYDPAGNIVEFIARHDLPNANNQPFSGDHILCVSEIGLALDDVQTTAAQMHDLLGLPYYKGVGGSDFQAVGDENGLFILVRNGRGWYPETGVKAGLYPVDVVIDSPANLDLSIYHIHAG